MRNVYKDRIGYWVKSLNDHVVTGYKKVHEGGLFCIFYIGWTCVKDLYKILRTVLSK